MHIESFARSIASKMKELEVEGPFRWRLRQARSAGNEPLTEDRTGATMPWLFEVEGKEANAKATSQEFMFRADQIPEQNLVWETLSGSWEV